MNKYMNIIAVVAAIVAPTATFLGDNAYMLGLPNLGLICMLFGVACILIVTYAFMVWITRNVK